MTGSQRRRYLRQIILLCFSLILCGYNYLYAQEDPTHYGIKAGFNLETLAGDPQLHYLPPKLKLGFNAGAIARTSLVSSFYLQPEFNITTKGAASDSTNYSGKLSLIYFEIPVLFGYRFENFAPKPFIYVGGATSLLIDAHLSLGGTNIDITDNITKIDLAALFGVTIELGGKLNKFELDARYMAGFVTIDDSGGDEKVYNRVFSLDLCLLFGRSE